MWYFDVICTFSCTKCSAQNNVFQFSRTISISNFVGFSLSLYSFPPYIPTLRAFFSLYSPSLLAEPCLSQPCRNGGRCSSLSGGLSYSCECFAGFTGPQCTQAPPPSLCANNPCRRGSCSVTETSFECNCPNGWTGATCDVGELLEVNFMQYTLVAVCLSKVVFGVRTFQVLLRSLFQCNS